MESKKLARLILRSAEILENSYSAGESDTGGVYTKTKDQSITEAFGEVMLSGEAGNEKTHWCWLVSLLLSNHLWNDSLDWARDILSR